MTEKVLPTIRTQRPIANFETIIVEQGNVRSRITINDADLCKDAQVL